MTYKNITIKMKGGKTRKQRVRVLASGKFKFVKNLSRSRTTKSKTKTKKRRKTKMGRRKRGRRNYSMTIPLAPVIGLVAGLAKPAALAYHGDLEGAAYIALENYTGFDIAGGFDIERLKRGLLPLVMGLLVHKFVGGPPLNLNRVLGRAKVPFIRI